MTHGARWVTLCFCAVFAPRLGYARISHGGLSDTEVQVAKFRFPQNPNSFTDNDQLVTDAAKVDQKLRFSKK